MYDNGNILIGKRDNPVYLLSKMANRHGLIAGATGTGKTVTLKVLAESFSEMGVPVFLSDIKGDLASLAVAGAESPKMKERFVLLGIEEFPFRTFPVQFWDIYGEQGHQVRTTVTEMGALLLSRILGLNDTQSGVLNIVFRIADDRGLLLLDLKDLRAMIQFVGENAKEYTLEYGNISAQSVGAILRSLLALEDQGGEHFFGEPELDFFDWMKTAPDGRGMVNVLHCERLFQSPTLYSTFLLWMLSELYETLPEVGDLERPNMVFFFDEAHLLFDDAPKVLIQKIEQVVRLIRSKGVGVFFITQNPMDLPESVLAQLGNRIQHALRAYTPAELKRVEVAAKTFRENPAFDTMTAITELATGEALISCLDKDGRPGIVERAWVMPPQSQFGTIDDGLRQQILSASSMKGKYDRVMDRESAYEMIQARIAKNQAAEQEEKERQEKLKRWEEEDKAREQELKRNSRQTKTKSSGYTRQTPMEKATNAVMSTIGREVGRTLIRGILGSLKK
ncbi:MAG: DUF853 domain-containing protein [Firmicutes bacterium HGW-Firmicutes-11]|jgi:hypothetical protein|nr:MAG: DUF853 domain-containing protein [Firmicutes bacterium HGW-Firmicutes-11]